MNPFLRHIQACNNHPGLEHLRPWRIGGQVIGYLAPDHAEWLTDLPGWQAGPEGLTLAVPAAARNQALAAAAGVLEARGVLRNRGELFDVRATPEGPSLAVLDRGALPPFGVVGQGVHVNGLVRQKDGPDGLQLWVGWRSRDKAVAPGQLDNLVAGGIPAGLTAEQCLVKEAEEEASVPEALARQARPVAQISYIMQVKEGTRRDVMHVYDLDLPEDFTPQPNDNEVERFELWPARRVLELVRDTDQVKFNVNLALIDLFLRERLINPDTEEGRALRQGLQRRF
jgi:8-oxo-dGTP pyrophosphatase MutT (NUDIX family)